LPKTVVSPMLNVPEDEVGVKVKVAVGVRDGVGENSPVAVGVRVSVVVGLGPAVAVG